MDLFTFATKINLGFSRINKVDAIWNMVTSIIRKNATCVNRSMTIFGWEDSRHKISWQHLDTIHYVYKDQTGGRVIHKNARTDTNSFRLFQLYNVLQEYPLFDRKRKLRLYTEYNHELLYCIVDLTGMRFGNGYSVTMNNGMSGYLMLNDIDAPEMSYIDICDDDEDATVIQHGDICDIRVDISDKLRELKGMEDTLLSLGKFEQFLSTICEWDWTCDDYDELDMIHSFDEYEGDGEYDQNLFEVFFSRLDGSPDRASDNDLIRIESVELRDGVIPEC